MLKDFFLFSLFLLIASTITAEDVLYELDADTINYDGSQVELIGNVTVQHALGKITSQSAYLIQSSMGKEKKPASIGFEENVVIAMKNRGVFYCSSGKIDFIEKKIYLYGGPIIFQEKLTIKSNQMVLSYDENNTVCEIEAFGDVTIDDPDRYKAKGHKAIYGNQGVVVLSPRSNDFCSIDTLHGVNIEAEEVSFDTKNSQVLLTKAKGLVNVIKEAPTDISADLAVWDETGGVLTLIGDATVSHPLIATICNSGRISFVWNESEIDYMTVVGETEITRMNHLGGADYHLTVGGNITIDHVLKRIYIEKKANQIQYTDKIGHVFGDTLVLDYDIKGKRIHPCKVQLTDNVKLLSIASASTDIDTNTAQYALAETMLYNPLTKELSLSGKNESRVLYYDKINNLQISAPKLFYTQGMKDTVKGVGDVRFRFVEQEINEIKKRFKFEG